MQCGACGTDNRQGRRFCARCGAPLTVACPACGFANDATDAFCGGCGQRLAPEDAAAAPRPASEPASPAPEAERRQLTVMFCDLVGSTALSGRLDPEDLRDHVRAYQAAAADVIARFEGHVAQYLGDGLLVYFGYPAAHEDDAQRAVRAALAIVGAVGVLNTRRPPDGVRLAVRIGVHTGLVVVGEVGGGARREQLALGETPNVAARLEALADPGTVVISAATHRLVARAFATRELGDHALRGVSTRLVVYQVLGERAAAPGGPIPGSTRLVGREREVALALERWEMAADGMGQVVLISGEAGIGKTRLTQAVCERVERVAHTRIEGRCSPYHQHSPMHPVAELLQRALGFEREDTPEVLLGRLERVLAEHGIPPAEGIPLLGSLLSLPVKEAYPASAWTPQRQRQRTTEIALELLRGLATRRPLLVVVEDLHWVDASSLEVLSLLVDQVATARTCVLLTARPDFRPPWAARSHIIQVMLSRLPQRQTEEMVLALAGKEMPGEVLRQVVAGADGVPLFVEELTKTVLESGLVRDQEHGYELAGPLRPLAIPATLQDSLMARLDRLGGAKSVAQLAAAIGREFSYEVLRAVSPLDEASLSTELARLVEAELVYQRGLPPAAQYIFKHALIQEAAYQSLLRTTRQGYHRRIAQVLAERFPQVGEIHPELMAHHYTEAGLAFEALPWWQRAGENAARRSASAEAIANLERGLALVPSVPDTPERARRELALLIALGPVFFGSHGFAAAETERVYRRAQELCDQLGDVPEVFPALWGQWGFSQIRGHSARAIEIAEQLLTLATASGDPELLVEAHHAMWATSVIRGAVAEGMEHIETGLALYDPEHHRSLAALYGGHDAASCGLAFGALALWVLGYPERAMERHRRAHGRLPGLNHPHTEANLHGWTALMLRCAGDFTGARAAAEVGLAVSTEHGLPQWAAMCLVVQGSARAALGDVEGGLAEMRRGVVGWRATRAVAFVPMYMAFIAEAELRRGDVAAGLRAVDEGLAQIAELGEGLFEAELHRLRGELLLAGTPPDARAAEASFWRAIEIARQQRAKSWELRAATSLARLWRGGGRQDDARRLLDDTAGWFTEGLATDDLRTARDLLGTLMGAA